MDVLLCCRQCGVFVRVAASGKDEPPCPNCGADDWILAQLAPERVERAGDDDAWKRSYDDWKTGGDTPGY